MKLNREDKKKMLKREKKRFRIINQVGVFSTSLSQIRNQHSKRNYGFALANAKLP